MITKWENNRFKKGFLNLGVVEGKEFCIALNDVSNILIKGYTGAGKTILLKSILRQLIDQKENCVVIDYKSSSEFEEFKEECNVITKEKDIDKIILELVGNKEAVSEKWLLINELDIFLDDENRMKNLEELINSSKVNVLMAYQGMNTMQKFNDEDFEKNIPMIFNAVQKNPRGIFNYNDLMLESYYFDFK